MSRPKVGMFAKYVIPQTSFDFALHRKDFRLIWAINCGSYSLVPLVPVYEAHLLDAQLDAVMRYSAVQYTLARSDPPSLLYATLQCTTLRPLNPLLHFHRLSMPLHIILGDNGSVSLPITCQWFSKDLEG